MSGSIIYRKSFSAKNKNKEDPEQSETETTGENDDSDNKSEKKAKKNLENAKPSEKPSPKGTVKSQTVRRKVPDSLRCSACHGEIKDVGSAHKAPEIDLIKTRVVDREYILHRGRCACWRD